MRLHSEIKIALDVNMEPLGGQSITLKENVTFEQSASNDRLQLEALGGGYITN